MTIFPFHGESKASCFAAWSTYGRTCAGYGRVSKQQAESDPFSLKILLSNKDAHNPINTIPVGPCCVVQSVCVSECRVHSCVIALGWYSTSLVIITYKTTNISIEKYITTKTNDQLPSRESPNGWLPSRGNARRDGTVVVWRCLPACCTFPKQQHGGTIATISIHASGTTSSKQRTPALAT